MLSRLKRNVPNIITCCNLLSGCVAIYWAYTCNARLALLWIIIGAVFDFFDGMTARLLHVSSPIGKELDSLADVVTFGVAPATIVFSELNALAGILPDGLAFWLPFSAFIIAAFSALRLAKFNIDTRQATSFIGMPTPANALFWGSFVVGQSQWLETTPVAPWIILGLVVLTSWLLVCELPMFSLKFKHLRWKDNNIKLYFSLFSVIMLIVFGWIDAWWLIIGAYVIVSACVALYEKKIGKQ